VLNSKRKHRWRLTLPRWCQPYQGPLEVICLACRSRLVHNDACFLSTSQLSESPETYQCTGNCFCSALLSFFFSINISPIISSCRYSWSVDMYYQISDPEQSLFALNGKLCSSSISCGLYSLHSRQLLLRLTIWKLIALDLLRRCFVYLCPMIPEVLWMPWSLCPLVVV
jgi:hypothetical protein